MAKKITAKKTDDVQVVKVKKVEPKEPVVVKAVMPFYDVEAGYTRSVNDQWQVTEERLTQLIEAGKAQNVTLVEVL